MAFLQKSGTEHYFFADRYIGSNARIKVFHYITPDTFATVEAADYFQVEWNGAINPGDIIHVRQVTDRNDLSTLVAERFYRVVSRSGSTLVIEPQSWEIDAFGGAFVSIREYGGLGDDATDNGLAVLAMEAAHPGKAFLLPSGTYRVNELVHKPVGHYFGPGKMRFTNAGNPDVDDEIWGGSRIPTPIWGAGAPKFPNVIRGINSGGALVPTDAGSEANFIDGFETANLLSGNTSNNTYISHYAGRGATGGSFNTAVGFGALQFATLPDRNTAVGANAGKEALCAEPWTIQGSDYYDADAIVFGALDTRMFGGDDEDPSTIGWIDKFPGVVDFWFDASFLPTIAARHVIAGGRPKAEFLPSIATHRTGNLFIGRDSGIHLSQSADSGFVQYKCGAGLVKASNVTAMGKGAGQNAFYWTDSVIQGSYACSTTVRIHQTVVNGKGALRHAASASNTVVSGFEAAEELGKEYVMATIDDFDGVNHNVIFGSQTARKVGTAINSIVIGSQTVHTAVDIALDSDIIIGFQAGDNIGTGVSYTETAGHRIIIGTEGAEGSKQGGYFWLGDETLHARALISGDLQFGRVAIGANPWTNATTSTTKDKYSKVFNVYERVSDTLIAWNDLTDHGWNTTWNDAGTTFTGLKLNVTNTASAAASLLADLQIGGVSFWKVAKTGAMTSTGGTVTTSTPLWNLTQTWNAAQTFNAILVDITSTSANAASTFIDMKDDTVSKFSVTMGGLLTIAGALAVGDAATTRTNLGVIALTQQTGEADLVAITGGEVPTEVEHNLLITKINAIEAKLEASGLFTTV